MNLANKVTMARIMLIPFLIIFLLPYPVWLTDNVPFFEHLSHFGTYYAALLFIITAATDKLDGYIARKHNMVTNLGKLLDPLADKLLISTALLLLVFMDKVPGWMAIIIIGREIIITALRVSASSKGIALAADAHGKIKMVFQVAAIAAVMLNNYPFALVTNVPIDMILMIIAVSLTLFSGYNYIKINYKRLDLNI